MNGLTPATQQKRLTARARVALLLADGGWHSNVEICHPHIGGNRGVGRLWELQRQGAVVEKRRVGVDQYEYRMVLAEKQGALAL